MTPLISNDQRRVNRIANACLVFNALWAARQKRWAALCGPVRKEKPSKEAKRRLTLAKAKAEAGL